MVDFALSTDALVSFKDTVARKFVFFFHPLLHGPFFFNIASFMCIACGLDKL